MSTPLDAWIEHVKYVKQYSENKDYLDQAMIVIDKLKNALQTVVGHEPLNGLEPRPASEALAIDPKELK